jgi:hypothetical protein
MFPSVGRVHFRKSEISQDVPKMAFVSEPHDYTAVTEKNISKDDIDIVGRIMSMGILHMAYATTGDMCTAGAARIEGTVLQELLSKGALEKKEIRLGQLVSPKGSRRRIRMAIQYAIDKGFPSGTLMHKGNTMKFTEEGFREWGYTLAREEFAEQTEAEADLSEGRSRKGKVVMKDRSRTICSSRCS